VSAEAPQNEDERPPNRTFVEIKNFQCVHAAETAGQLCSLVRAPVQVQYREEGRNTTLGSHEEDAKLTWSADSSQGMRLR